MALPVIAAVSAMLIPVAKVILAARLATIVLKVVTRVIILGIILSAFYAILVTIQNVLNGLSASAPALIQTAYSWFVPSNFGACMSAIITVQLIIWAWHWKQYAFNLLTGGVS